MDRHLHVLARCDTLVHRPPAMRNTPAFLLLLLLLLPLLLLFLLPGGCLGSAPDLPCPSIFQTVDHQYRNITTARRIVFDQINTTMYVRPQRGLTVVLGVEGRDAKYYYTEFSLEEDCFEDDWQWWELLVKVKSLGSNRDYNNRINTEYKLQVRTSTCIIPCLGIMYSMHGLVSLHVLASGASQWTLDHPEKHCGTIAHWNRDPAKTIPACKDIHPPALSTTPATPSATNDTPLATTTTPSATNATHSATLAKTSANTAKPSPAPATPYAAPATPLATTVTHIVAHVTPTGSEIGGITAGVVAGIIVVAAIIMTVVRKRRAEPTTEAAAMSTHNAESPREEPLHATIDRQGSVNSLYATVDRHESLNSLYGTVDRQSSLNSLYEPLENFRATQ